MKNYSSPSYSFHPRKFQINKIKLKNKTILDLDENMSKLISNLFIISDEIEFLSFSHKP